VKVNSVECKFSWLLVGQLKSFSRKENEAGGRRLLEIN